MEHIRKADGVLLQQEGLILILKKLTTLITYLIKNMSDSLVNYRKLGNKQYTAPVDASLDDQSLTGTLSELAD